MSHQNLFKCALCDLADDLAYHAGNLVHRAFDILCLLALGMLVYVTGIDPANAGLHSRPLFGVQASIAGTSGIAVSASHAPTACGLTNDLIASAHRSCTDAMVLDPAEI